VFQNPRGTRDFTSEEMKKRNSLEESIKKVFQNYGYKEIETPTFENLDLFTAKSGEGIISEIYSFKDKGDRELALRPELTAPVMRFYVEKLQMEPKPLKLFYFGNCYRYDRPQKGRYREFKQAGCELIGTSTPEAIAELISMAYKIIENTGLKDMKLKIGNLKILSSIFEKINLKKDQIEYIIPLIDKELFDDLYNALQEFGLDNKAITTFINLLETEDLNQIKKFAGSESEEEINRFEKIIDLVKKTFKIKNFKVTLGIVRGLDYYTGTVFEIEAPSLGAEKQICGGGEYQLVSLFGGRETDTSGFAIGFDRVLLALETEGYSFSENYTEAFVIPVTEDMKNKAIEITEKLRKSNIVTDQELNDRSMSKSLKYANSINAKKVIIVGPDEMKEKKVTVKDMITGKQKQIEIGKILEIF